MSRKVTFDDPNVKDPKMPEVEVGGEYLVLMRPYTAGDGRRTWAWLATFGCDERKFAEDIAAKYKFALPEMAVVVAQVVGEAVLR